MEFSHCKKLLDFFVQCDIGVLFLRQLPDTGITDGAAKRPGRDDYGEEF
jgi:hypothetical protein